MVNPLRGFISDEDRLFEALDSGGRGINVFSEQGILTAIFDYVFRKAEWIEVAGDVVAVDKISAERFFERNEDLLEGRDIKQMSLRDKLLYLLKRNKKLPRNVLEEEAVGGEEAKKTVFGEKRKFIRLAQELQKNAFEVTHLLKLIQEKGGGLLCIEREEIFHEIIEENKGRLEELKDSTGDERVRRLANLLIKNIRSESFRSE